MLFIACSFAVGIGSLESAYAIPVLQQTTEVQTKEVHVKVKTVHRRRPKHHRKKLVITAPEVKIQNTP